MGRTPRAIPFRHDSPVTLPHLRLSDETFSEVLYRKVLRGVGHVETPVIFSKSRTGIPVPALPISEMVKLAYVGLRCVQK